MPQVVGQLRCIADDSIDAIAHLDSGVNAPFHVTNPQPGGHGHRTEGSGEGPVHLHAPPLNRKNQVIAVAAADSLAQSGWSDATDARLAAVAALGAEFIRTCRVENRGTLPLFNDGRHVHSTLSVLRRKPVALGGGMCMS